MSDEHDFSFTAPEEGIPFLKNDSRDTEGSMLFAKLQKPIVFVVAGWQPFTDSDGVVKAALILEIEDGSRYLWPIGSSARLAFSKAGASHPDNLVGASVWIEAYETGNENPQFAIGKRVTDVKGVTE